MKTLHSSERGIAHLALILVAVLVLGVGGAGYYVFSKQKKADSGSDAALSESSKAMEAECKKEIDDKDFCKFVSNWSYGKEQRMTMTQDGNTSVIETDADGNTKMVTTKDGSEVAAFISIGKASYMKNVDDGSWTKYTSETTDTATPEPTEELEEDFKFDEELAKDTSKYTKKDKEACGNLTCFKYEITDTTRPSEITTVWFDDDDYKLRKMVLVSPEGYAEFELGYDVAKITEPSPVVDAPDYANMTTEELEQLMQQYSTETE